MLGGHGPCQPPLAPPNDMHVKYTHTQAYAHTSHMCLIIVAQTFYN
jgi:hypothetical protein